MLLLVLILGRICSMCDTLAPSSPNYSCYMAFFQNKNKKVILSFISVFTSLFKKHKWDTVSRVWDPHKWSDQNLKSFVYLDHFSASERKLLYSDNTARLLWSDDNDTFMLLFLSKAEALWMTLTTWPSASKCSLWLCTVQSSTDTQQSYTTAQVPTQTLIFCTSSQTLLVLQGEKKGGSEVASLIWLALTISSRLLFWSHWPNFLFVYCTF